MKCWIHESVPAVKAAVGCTEHECLAPIPGAEPMQWLRVNLGGEFLHSWEDGPLVFHRAAGDYLILLCVQFTPMRLNRSGEPFSSPDWVFELKYDGFCALAEIEYGRCRLISRNGNAFATFKDLAPRIGRLFPRNRVVLDGEIVCMDESGRPQFTSLLYHRGEPSFIAFDLLYDTGNDLRREQLLDRKAALRRLLGHVRRDEPLMYADHME